MSFFGCQYKILNFMSIFHEIHSIYIHMLSISMLAAAEVCFNELGCFDNLPPWGGTDQRPVSILPWHHSELGTRFLLFTQKNRYYQARECFIFFGWSQ